jgi:protein arginine N-methyltransferase 7
MQKAREMGVEPHVLDIGTGTGLLSLMAAKCGVKKITACEALKPMAKVAKDIVHKNGYQDVITVLPKRSTEMTVGVDGDMKDRANILVTEMFDTELIGEAALSTFLHAHQQLLQKGSIVVPQTAMVLVQPVRSTFLHSSHSIHPHMVSSCTAHTPSILTW